MSQIKLQPPRGTRDLVGEEFRRHHRVIKTARRISALYGFEEWATPIFEDTRVFARGLGETSDVVSKEMYEFKDRGGESVTLRPENTAGVCRALVSNGLTQSLPRKVFYAGPMFRYERPQAGRYRQFHQIGAEILGAAEPLADAEVIACGYHIIRELGLDEGVILEVNTLGDAASRDAYRAALIAHFTAHREQLSEDSQRRLEKNPLRIIDSKEAQDRALVADAPTIEPFLTEAARAHWDALRRHLTTFAVPFRENPRIVRGLDYYSHTAFEFVTERLGAQGTVMGGGRYDGLVEEMGGPPTPSVGWAAGVERLAMLMEKAGLTPPAPRLVTVIPVSEAEEGVALNLLQSLRAAGIGAEMGYRGNLKRRMERANKQGARVALIIGETEAAQGVAQLRDLDAGTQEQVPFAALTERLKK
ncbi:histidine--tRNA ligase [Sediminicoccus sp. BL-A-41-H5]|uniref:histidine--tRNA ligase n=1 Tax=Sediminicoccus sp. BL-A-41-H5 TaxID=3421106 RepID=UPI003D66EAB4